MNPPYFLEFSSVCFPRLSLLTAGQHDSLYRQW